MLPTQLSPQQQITLARIAERHSVLLGSNDPILMVQTMLESAQEDITHSQAARLKQFGEDLETGLHRWEDAAQALLRLRDADVPRSNTRQNSSRPPANTPRT